MTLARAWTRLVRLEEQVSQRAWYDVDLAHLLRWIAEAGAQADLAPDVLQALCVAVRHAGEALGQHCPRSYRIESDAHKTVMTRMVSMIRTTIDAQLTEKDMRARMHQEMQQVLLAKIEAERRTVR